MAKESTKREPRLTVVISTATILKSLGLLVGLWFLYAVRDIVVIVFVALILSSIIEGPVAALERRRFPRPLAVLSIYLATFLVLAGVVALAVPPLAEQISLLSTQLPTYYDRLLEGFSNLRDYSETHGLLTGAQEGLQSLQVTFDQASSGVLNFVTGVFGGLVSVILTLVITFYFAIERDAISKLAQTFVPAPRRAYANDAYRRIEQQIGRWVKGELVLVLVIGTLAFFGLVILGVRAPLVLAVIAGISEIVPYVGPVLGAVPAVLLALTQSVWKGLVVIILYWVIQQIENHLIVPKVMQRALGLNPIVTILAILIGFRVAGVIGAVLAVPVTTAGSVILKDVVDGRFGKPPAKAEAA